MINVWRRRAVMLAGLWLLAASAGTPARAELEITLAAPGIYYGAAPSSEADYAQLQHLGIQTVLDMRKFLRREIAKECDMAQAYGMTYIQVPVGFRPSRDGSPDEVLSVLANAHLHPIYVHCNLGRDRTGLVIAIYRVRYLGWSPDAAYAQMREQRFNPLLRDMDRYFWNSVGGESSGSYKKRRIAGASIRLRRNLRRS